MVRTAALALLALTGCDRLQRAGETDQSFVWQSAKHEVEITELRAEIERLKAEDKFQSEQMMRMAAAHDNLAETVSKNARVANENAKIDDARWKWAESHVHR